MGTRSITVVKNENGDKIIEMYRQFDGYPSGMGQELIDFITPFAVVDGLGIDNPQTIANGMPCFAAQLVEHFKDGAGGTYLYTPTTDFKNKKKYGETYNAEYYYEISKVDKTVRVRCWNTYTGTEILTDPYGKKFIEKED